MKKVAKPITALILALVVISSCAMGGASAATSSQVSGYMHGNFHLVPILHDSVDASTSLRYINNNISYKLQYKYTKVTNFQKSGYSTEVVKSFFGESAIEGFVVNDTLSGVVRSEGLFKGTVWYGNQSQYPIGEARATLKNPYVN